MVRIVLVDAVDGGLFGRDIGFADEIVMTLALDIELLEASHLLNENRSGASRGHYGHIE
jgi:hypothetical protein